MIKLFFTDLKNTFLLPHMILRKDISFSEIIFYMFFTVFCYLFVSISFISVFYFLGIDVPKNNWIESLNIFEQVIRTPIIEEIVFRSLLVINNLSILLFFNIFLIPVWKFYFSSNTSFILSICSAFIFNQLNILKVKEKINLALIYLSSFAFGILHVESFSNITLYDLQIVIPKIFVGFLLAMIRIKFGLLFSIISHSFINLIPICLTNAR